MSTGPRGVVLVKGTGGAGLGDLIRALLAGIHYATLSGRAIIPCWDDGLYGTVGQDVFPRLLRLEGIASPPLADLDPDDVVPAAWRGRLHLPFGQVYALERADEWNRTWALTHLSFDQTRLDYPESTLVMWEFDQFPALWAATRVQTHTGENPDEVMRVLAMRHLRPSNAIAETVQQYYERKFVHPMIGVHVRRSFERGAELRHTELKQVFWLVDRLIAKCNGNAGIFLATDNKKVEIEFQACYPHVLATGKWFGSPGVPLHYNDETPDKTQIAIEALVDLYLLAACDWLIHPAASSFSRVAAILGDIPRQRIYEMPPGSRSWRGRLNGWWWTRKASSARSFRHDEPPYFLR